MNKKTIIVTGATGVLGQLVAKTFAAGGHNLVLLDRDSIKLDYFHYLIIYNISILF